MGSQWKYCHLCYQARPSHGPRMAILPLGSQKTSHLVSALRRVPPLGLGFATTDILSRRVLTYSRTNKCSVVLEDSVVSSFSSPRPVFGTGMLASSHRGRPQAPLMQREHGSRSHRRMLPAARRLLHHSDRDRVRCSRISREAKRHRTSFSQLRRARCLRLRRTPPPPSLVIAST